MSLQVTYNTVTFDPVISWTESVTPVFANSGKEVTGYDHTFVIDGFLEATDASGRASDITTIVTKLRESNADLTITQDGTDIRSFDAADVQGTGPWSSFAIPGDDPLKVGFNTPVTLTVRGRTDPPTASGGTVADTYTDTYAYDKQLRKTFTRRGNLSTQSGTSARGKFAGTDPLSSLDTATVAWELQRKEEQVDEDNQNLTYTWVYVEAHEQNATTAKDISYTIQSSVQDQTEIWVASGSLRWEIGTKMDVKEVATILKSNSAWPSKGKVTGETFSDAPRSNSITFTVRKEVPFGQGSTLFYEESVTTTTNRAIRDYHKLTGTGGQDVRQELHAPEVVIVQTGRWVKQGSYPTEPQPVIQDKNALVSKRFTKLPITYDVNGQNHRFGLTWSYEFRPLNTVQPGNFRAAVDPSQSNPVQGQSPSRKSGAK